MKVYCVRSNVGGSERSWLWDDIGGSERTGRDVWHLKCQASNVKASDHLLHGYMLPVFFNTDQWHSKPRCGEIHPMSQQAAVPSRNTSVSIHALLL